MNWDAIGAIAELAGAIGVILSLAYLAMQIRQNTGQMERTTRAARGAAYQDALVNYQSYLTPVAENGELAEIFRKGLQDFDELSEVERFRFMWILGGFVTNMDNIFYQHQDGLISDERWKVTLNSLRWFIRTPGFKQWWPEFDESTLSPELAAIVQSELEALHPPAGNAP